MDNHPFQGRDQDQINRNKKIHFWIIKYGLPIVIAILIAAFIFGGCSDVNRAFGGSAVEVPTLNRSCAVAEITGPNKKALGVLDSGESTNLKFSKSFLKNQGGFYLVATVIVSPDGCRDELGEIDDEYIDFDPGDYDVDRWEINF